MMTKKVFRKVAQIICETTIGEKECGEVCTGFCLLQDIRRTLCNEFTELFAEENPRFNAEKFEEACYGGDKNGR